MKNASDKIIQMFPSLQSEHQKLTVTEEIFKKLLEFFEHPYEKDFPLSLLLKLDAEMRQFALTCLHTFFQTKDMRDFLPQKDFAQYLTDKGFHYSEAKLSVYKRRGLLPVPDLVLANRQYWHIQTVKTFCESLKRSDQEDKDNIYKK